MCSEALDNYSGAIYYVKNKTYAIYHKTVQIYGDFIINIDINDINIDILKTAMKNICDVNIIMNDKILKKIYPNVINYLDEQYKSEEIYFEAVKNGLSLHMWKIKLKRCALRQ
jgi:hypothetical protein